MDLKAYKSQIRELIPLRNTSDFSELLDKILFGESNSDKFLIKMEVSRLSKPCQRLLDLRDKILEPCELFEQNNNKHYLTKASIKVLEENIQLYGLYTVGAFEAVHEFIALQKAKQQQQIEIELKKEEEVTENQCELLALSEKNKRGAPRMFYVTDIMVSTDDGQKFKAQTSNISATGMKIKLTDDFLITNKSFLNVTFTGLALENDDKVLTTAIKYSLVKQENNIDNYRYFYLSYQHSDVTFSQFIRDFIRLNQYKYKIDVQYYYQLAKISALKHAYLAQMHMLPIYLNADASTPFIFALENEANTQLILDWQCNGKDQLPHLFNSERLNKLAALLHSKASTTLYTFTHKANGKEFFLCATEEELIGAGLKELFIQTGFNTPKWKAYQLTLSEFQYKSDTNYNITETIPDTFYKITHIATLKPLVKVFPFNVQKPKKNSDSSQLNQFIEPTQSAPKFDSVFSLFSKELRKEERYEYKSAISVSDKNKNYTGKMLDFSLSGLKIKLDQIAAFSVSSKILISLTELQTKSKAYQLTNLQYRVVRTSAKGVLHLQVCEQATLDITQSFFSLLVRNNAKHFTCQPLQAKKQPLQKQLFEIAEESFLNIVFFISKITSRPVINFSAIDLKNHPLQALFSFNSASKQELDYTPIANNQLFERLVIAPFRRGEDDSIYKEALIYIKAVKKEQDNWQIESYLDEDFKTQQSKLTFINESHLNAKFYALHFRLTELPKLDTSCIEAEMRAISRYAMHLTKKLDEELMAVEGMIEITDRTEDVINTVKKTQTKGV